MKDSSLDKGSRINEWAHKLLAALEQSRVLRNRGALLRARLVGRGGKLHFQDGFSMPVQASNLALAINLVRLSYFGATLTTPDDARWGTWVVSFDDGTLRTPEGIRFCLDSLEPGIFAETYIHQIHFFGFDLKGKAIVDVGGFVGDTALYFAYHGAKVFVYEPDPMNHSLLLRNLRLNPGLADHITVWNKAVGVQGSIPMGIGLKGGSGIHASSPHTQLLPSVDLTGVLEENHILKGDILKLDSKGTEFDLLSQPALSQFDFVSCEYSADLVGRSPQILLDYLKKAGFDHVRVFKHNCFYYRIQDHGTIQAMKGGGMDRGSGRTETNEPQSQEYNPRSM